MRYALVNEERSLPLPGIRGICPGCGDEVIARCGQINVWHWAHTSSDCDTWYEPESEWHIGIKNLFHTDLQEVVIPPHRADIRLRNGHVIELQHSSISAEDIVTRELFYNDMEWLIDGTEFEDNFLIRHKNGYFTFRWLHYRKTWGAATKRIGVHLPKQKAIFIVKKHYDGMKSGWGELIHEDSWYAEEKLIKKNDMKLTDTIITFLEQQNDWVPQEEILRRGAAKGYKRSDLLFALSQVKEIANIGYNYKTGYRWYPKKEGDEFMQHAINTF